ncbi:MAG: GbsR/MarR family transcriptional regulator [Stackebrandtia sp.]
MAIITPEEREFVERCGLFHVLAGQQRISGLIVGWLLISKPPHQSITELADALDISKASASTVVRRLQQARIVERHPVPGSRQHYYRITGGGNWIEITRARMELIRLGRELGEHGVSLFGDDPQRQERISEYADFLAFMEEQFGDEVLARWEAFRRKRIKEREASR